MTLTKRQLQDLGTQRGHVVRDAVVAAGRWDGNGAAARLEVTPEAFRAATQTAATMPAAAPSAPVGERKAVVAPKLPSAPDLVALPPDKWPNWAKIIALLSQAEDAGVGDTVARIIGPETSAAFKAWHLAKFGKPCGCERRQAEWNARFPYPIPKPLTSHYL